MPDRNIILIALGITFALLLIYAISFIGTPISSQTSDWGAFGSYAAICVSSLSIALIYVTYREQRKTNEITRVEQHIQTMTNTLVVLSEKYYERLQASYDKFSKHFKVSFYYLYDCEYSKIINICTRYYYDAVGNDHTENINYLFQYMQLCIDYILHEKSLSEDNKRLRITELSCILPESMRIMLFCWLLINKSSRLKIYYKSRVFMLDEKNSYALLEDIITYISTGKLPPKRQIQEINPDNIIFEDFPNEQFYDTYNRLFKNS